MTLKITAKDESTQRILEAASYGDIDYLKKLPGSSIVITARCSSGCTALHWAAGCNQVKMILYLVNEVAMNVDTRATKKANGRTPLHYSCRNGCLEASKLLVKLGANVNAKAKHGVSPFQLSIWQNHLSICQWLVLEEGVDPLQVNDFNCGAVHWIGLCPHNRANHDVLIQEKTDSGEECLTSNDDGYGLIPLAKWLSTNQGIDFRLVQKQGHTSLHKAAWGGHISLIKYLRDEHNIFDDVQDNAGNYAADMADMAGADRHVKVAQFLRNECSAEKAKSCSILGVSVNATFDEIRRSYLNKAKKLHPDKIHLRIIKNNSTFDESANSDISEHDFDSVRKAYEHLIVKNGVGSQSNPSHALNLMIELNNISMKEMNDDDTSESKRELSLFKARLYAVLLEYGDKGIEICNIKKKWRQLWPKNSFPDVYESSKSSKKKGKLAEFVQKYAGDVVEFRKNPDTDKNGSLLLVPKKTFSDARSTANPTTT